MKKNPKLQQNNPMDIRGIDQSNILLLPIRSIKNRAMQVIEKFVKATDNEVNVGFEKPRI